MARIKQSICVPMFQHEPANMSLEEICKAAAEIGYPAVEFWGHGENFDEEVATAKRHGLAVASFTGSGAALNNRADHDEVEEGLKASMDLAARQGIPGIICLQRQPPARAERERRDRDHGGRSPPRRSLCREEGDQRQPGGFELQG